LLVAEYKSQKGRITCYVTQRQHDDDKHLGLMEASLDGVLAGFPLPGWSKKHASYNSLYLFFLFLHSPLDVIDLDNDAVDIAKCLGRLSHFFQGAKRLFTCYSLTPDELRLYLRKVGQYFRPVVVLPQ